jgi:osmotically inducible protein OsmC
MAKVLYTAKAHVTGGRLHGHGETSDGALEVDIRPPKELGGPGEGTNPEQLFAIGYAACFESAVTTVARRMKVEPGDVVTESSVSLVSNENRGFDLTVELDLTLPGLEGEEALALVRAAHQVCPYSNAVRGNIPVTITVNGQELGEA